MRTAEFREALDAVLERAHGRRTAVMCSETLWWRCHRRLIADAAALVHDVRVLHVDGRGATEAHRITETAHRDGERVVYAAQPELL
jgi:uncharacterized protein (DUF488 family)